MNYKKIGIIFGIVSFILIINNIFGAGLCIEEIMHGLPDGAIINPQSYNLKFEAPKGKSVVIEVIQGGYFDTRKYCINVGEGNVNIFGWLNTRTAPLQVICYEARDPSMGGSVTPGISSENGCWQKGRTLQTYTLFINKEEGIEESIKGVGTTISNTSLLNSTIPTDYNITTNESTTQKEDNDNRIYSFFALIISLITIWFIFEHIYKIGGPFKPASFILSAFIIASLLVITDLNVFQIGILVIVLLAIGAGNLGKTFDKIKEVK